MSARYHDMPTSVLESLASGGGGPEAIRELRAWRHRKHAILLRGVLDAAQSAAAGVRGSPGRAMTYSWRSSVGIRKRPRGRCCIPLSGAWALRVVRAHRSEAGFPGAEPEGLGAVAVAAAVRAGFPAEIEVAATGEAVMLPSLGAADVGGGTAVVRNAEGNTEVVSAGRRVRMPAEPHGDAPGWRGLRRVRAGSLDVLIDDLDPFRMPSSTDLSPRLSADELGRLSAASRSAWPILEEFHPAVADEVLEAVSVIVPLTSARGGLVSTSSSATFGAVGLSEPPDPYWCAVTFAHEIQHLKLSALLDIVPMTLPDEVGATTRHGERTPGRSVAWCREPTPSSG